MANNKPVVVVGAGQAAASFISRYAALGNTAPVLLIGDEPSPPYQRPPLSKGYLIGAVARERLFIRSGEWYAEQGIAMRLGTRVVSIDPVSRKLLTDSDETIHYGKLVLCTGSKPRSLPAALGGELPGVHSLRNIADAEAMMPELRAGRKLLIIGGGYIGLEVAAVARKSGLEVAVVEMADRILQRVAATETSDFFRRLHREQGVDIYESAHVAGLDHDSGRVCGARLKSGEQLAADLVLAGIGAIPNVELAEQAGLACDNGVVVDDQCRTSNPHIYAAGDCASFLRNGRRTRLESVQNAADQGALIACVLAGENAHYDALPRFWSDQYDCKLQIAGLNTGYTNTVVRPGVAPAGQSVWYFAAGQLLAVEAMNDPVAYVMGRKMLLAGKNPPLGQIADPTADLKLMT